MAASHFWWFAVMICSFKIGIQWNSTAIYIYNTVINKVVNGMYNQQYHDLVWLNMMHTQNDHCGRNNGDWPSIFLGYSIFRQAPIMDILIQGRFKLINYLFRPWRASYESYASWVQDTSWSRFAHFGPLHRRWLCWCTCRKDMETPDDFNGLFKFLFLTSELQH